MNSEQQIFLALLRAGLWNTPADVALFSGQTDWETIFIHAARQTVLGLVATGTGMLPCCCSPPVSVAKRLRDVTTVTIRSHALLNRTLAVAVKLLRQNGIHPVLLKGQGVATNYIDPYLRMCGDIDLYIGQRDYDKACEVVRQWAGTKEGIESEKHYHFKHGDVTVELHCIAERLVLPWQNTSFQRWTHKHLHNDYLRSVEIEGTAISLPPVNFDALYIFNHAWHHFSEGEGIGLRQLCDWVRYLHIFRGEINRIEMERDLKSFGLWYPWQIFGPIAVDMLGLPREEYPFYTDRYARQAARVISMIEVDGNFGFFDPSRMKRPEGYIAGKVHSFRRMSNRFGKLFLISPKEAVSAWSNYLYIGIKQVITDTLNPLKT